MTTEHGYLTGSKQYIKRFKKETRRQIRRERRDDDWKNVRILCVCEILSNGDDGDGDGASKLCSLERSQARTFQRRSNSSNENVESKVSNDANNNTNDSIEFFM